MNEGRPGGRSGQVTPSLALSTQLLNFLSVVYLFLSKLLKKPVPS